jgi:hypothetical protein
VDGLDTWQPRDAGMYAQVGQHLAEHGYLNLHDDGALALIGAGGNAVSVAQGESRSLTQMHWSITVNSQPKD